MVFFFIHAYKKKLETLYQKPKEATKTVVFLNICMTLHRYMHGYTEKRFVGYQKELADPILDHGPCEQRKPNNMIHKTNQV